MTEADQSPSERYSAWLAINEAILLRNYAEVERQVTAPGGGESVENAVSTLRKKSVAFIKANILRLKERLA